MKLINILNKLDSKKKVLVIGDFMLDTYIHGEVSKICPEAPVPVLRAKKEESRPGGAGNVVLNLCSLGMDVSVVGRVGYDFAGEEIRSSLEVENVDVKGLLLQNRYKTPIKKRFIASSQQILRVDFEELTSLPKSLEEEVVKNFSDWIQGCDVVAISDYDKGFLSCKLISVIIKMSKERNIPVVVDPKGSDFSKYMGATILKPNLFEAYTASKLLPDNSLDEVASEILKICCVDQLIITRSQEGISLFENGEGRRDFPVCSKEVKDVTGAGDTVLSVLSVAIANGLDIHFAVRLANIAAGISIERSGCARINLSDIAERAMVLDVENKVFDNNYIFALQQSVKNKRCSILSLESSSDLSIRVFSFLREISRKHKEHKLIIHLRGCDPKREFTSMLSSLSEVDFIFVNCINLESFCEVIKPDKIYLLEANNLIELEGSFEQLANI